MPHTERATISLCWHEWMYMAWARATTDHQHRHQLWRPLILAHSGSHLGRRSVASSQPGLSSRCLEGELRGNTVVIISGLVALACISMQVCQKQLPRLFPCGVPISCTTLCMQYMLQAAAIPDIEFRTYLPQRRWPSGLRRQTQVLVHESEHGFKSHSAQFFATLQSVQCYYAPYEG